MELISSARRFTLSIVFVILYSAVLLWFCVFFYGIVYYLYIPAVAHVHPVYFQYDAVCKGRVCKNPSANVSLVKPGYPEYCHLLTGGQVYAIELVLDMPESEKNREQGMFMIKLVMTSKNGVVLQTSSRPAVLHYRSPLFRMIYTLFFSPALLFGTLEEKQTLVVPLFEHYVEVSYGPTLFAFIEIQARSAEIYSSNLRIHAQFTGLRYFMYYWPLSSALICVGSTFLTLWTITLFIWICYIMKNRAKDDSGNRSTEIPREIPLPSNDRHESSKPTSSAKSCAKHSDLSEQQNLPPQEVDRGIEVLPIEEFVNAPEVPELHETEADLVAGLRRRNL